MFENKLFVAICISTVLAILIFRTNYVAAIAVQRQKYAAPKGKYRYDLLLLDIFVTIIFALIGCYIAWDSITVISGLQNTLILLQDLDLEIEQILILYLKKIQTGTTYLIT